MCQQSPRRGVRAGKKRSCSDDTKQQQKIRNHQAEEAQSATRGVTQFSSFWAVAVILPSHFNKISNFVVLLDFSIRKSAFVLRSAVHSKQPPPTRNSRRRRDLRPRRNASTTTTVNYVELLPLATVDINEKLLHLHLHL